MKANFSTPVCAVDLPNMYKTIVVVTLFALAASAMAIDTTMIREATQAKKMLAGNGMSANPLLSFQGGCQNCVGAYPGT